MKILYRVLLMAGIDFKKLFRALNPNRSLRFYKDLKALKKQRGADDTFRMGSLYPIITNSDEEGGKMKGYYFHQDLYTARKIYEANPEKHLDIGSRTDGFVAHVAAFREIELIDIRDISSKVKNVHFRQADLMSLPDDLVEYCDSISSLHAIEHFGLGRYGDPIDYHGHTKALENISKILKPGGRFYFSTPIGPQRIEFNAHRVFSLAYIMKELEQYFELKQFSYVDDSGDLHEDHALTPNEIESSLNCSFGCGIFVLDKLPKT